jgi:hypothetical protein
VNLSRAGLFGSAFFVAAVLALAPTTALAYNSNNHGHHYGQLKHLQVPAPNPPPAVDTNPAQASGPATASHPSAGESAPAVQPVATIPLPVADPIEVVASNPERNLGISWLVLLILPALLAVWLMVFARGAVTVSRLMRRTVAAA